MANRKRYIFIGIIAMIAVSIIGTFAWYTFGTKKSSLVLVLGNSDDLLVTLSPFELDIVADPVTNYTSMSDYTSVVATNNKNVTANFKFYYDIAEIDSNLASSSMKYAITRSNSLNGTNTEIANGSFLNANSGDHRVIYEESIPTSGTYYYKIYTYLDGNQSNASSLEDKEMKISIGADINPSNKAIGVDVTFKYDDITNDRWFFGENYYVNGDIGTYQFGIYGSNFLFMMTDSSKNRLLYYKVSSSDTNKHNLKFNISGYGSSFDGNFLFNNYGSNSNKMVDNSSYNLYIFGRNGNLDSTYWGTTRIYSLLIYNGNSVVRNYYPCYNKNSGEYGLYDYANSTFYPNEGTGTFLYGYASYITSDSIVNINSNHTLYAVWN